MTGGPSPVAGTNPYPKTYQVEQFDTTLPAAKSVLDSLKTPPAAGITAETTPAHVFNQNAGGNPTSGTIDNPKQLWGSTGLMP